MRCEGRVAGISQDLGDRKGPVRKVGNCLWRFCGEKRIRKFPRFLTATSRPPNFLAPRRLRGSCSFARNGAA